MSYTVTTTVFPEVHILSPKVFGDQRGYFFESFNKKDFQKATGLDVEFVQEIIAVQLKVYCEDCIINYNTHKENWYE